MKKNLWILGIIIAFIVVSLGTYNYLSESQKIIKVGYLPSDHHAALIVAQQKGMFEKEGLEVQMVPFHSGADIAYALSLGKIDIGYCGITPITQAISNGNKLKIVAPVNLEGSGIVIPNNANISSNILINKTIAIPSKGSVQDILLYIYLKQNNISPSSISYYKSEVPMMPLGLKEGSFDAYVAWEPFVSMINVYDYGNVLVYSKNIWKKHPCCVVVTSDKFINKNPQKLRKFLKIHVKTTQYINEHPSETAAILYDKMGTSLEIEKEGISEIEYLASPNPEFNKNVMKIVKIQQQMGYIKNNFSGSQIFNFKYL
jgi:NitT/TauT family transport system substrate-binding protein